MKRITGDSPDVLKSSVGTSGLFGAVLLCVLLVMSLALGVVTLPPDRLLSALVAPTADPVAAAIVMNVRLPRTLIACCAGILAALAALNLGRVIEVEDVYDPGWSGVLPLSALGAVVMLIIARDGQWSILGALIGSIIGVLLFMTTRRRLRRLWQQRVVSWGIVIGAPALAFALLIGEVRIATWVRWCIGSLEQRDWQTWRSVWPLFLVAIPVAAMSARRPGRSWLHLAGAVLASAAVVTAAGAIGWIGRMAACWARSMSGPGLRRTVIAGLLGAVLLMGVDLGARGLTMFIPSPGLIGELPVGAVLIVLSIASFLIERVRLLRQE